jgi:DNA-binding beta-propeller fold protein YncE
VIRIDNRRTVAAVPVGDEPHRVALTPDDQYALVLNRGSGDMAVIRRRTVESGRERVTAPFTLIPVGSRPEDLAIEPR